MRRFAQFSTICTNLKNINNHEVVILLVKLQDESYIFTKSNTPPGFFFHVFKIIQMVPHI